MVVIMASLGGCDRAPMVAKTPTPGPQAPIAPISPETAARVTQLAVLNPHDGHVRSAAWAHSGTMLATGSAHQIELWDGQAETQVGILRGDTDAVASVAWSPDDRQLASASEDGSVRVWDVAQQRQRLLIPATSDFFLSVAWSPDGSRLVTGNADGTVQVWDAATGKSLALWLGNTAGRFHAREYPLAVYGAAWSPDGKIIASTRYDGILQFWDAISRKSLAVAPTSFAPNGNTWAPDGRQVAVGNDDGGIQIFDAQTFTSTDVLLARPEDGWAYAVPWSPDGRLIAESRYSGAVQIWDVARRLELKILRRHTDQVRGVAWSADAMRLATAGDDGVVRLWGVATPPAP